MQQAEDFRAESRALAAVLATLDDADFDRPTLFKGWTIDHVIGHLHMQGLRIRVRVDRHGRNPHPTR